MEPFDSDQPCWVMMYYPRAGGRGVRTAAARKASARAAAGEGFVVDGDSSQRERKDRTPFGTLISSIASSPYRNLSAGAPAVVAAGAAGDVRTARVRPSCTQGCSGAIDVRIGDAVQPEGHQSQHRLELDSVKPPPTSATDGGNLIKVSLHHMTSCSQTAPASVGDSC